MSWWSNPTSKHAFILSWISVVMTAAAAVAGILFYMATGSALCLVFGLENIVDFLSSIVVLWRFYCPGELTKEREDLLHKREKRASIAISFILVFLGVCVGFTSLFDLLKGRETDKEMQVVIAIAAVSVFIFGTMTAVKIQYSNMLESASLKKDGLCSLIGTVLSCGLLVTTFVIENFPSAWWLDPLFAILCGFAALIIGAHAIYFAKVVQGLPVFTLSWWFVSQGDGMDEMTGRDLDTADFGEEDVKDTEMTDTNDATQLSGVV